MKLCKSFPVMIQGFETEVAITLDLDSQLNEGVAIFTLLDKNYYIYTVGFPSKELAIDYIEKFTKDTALHYLLEDFRKEDIEFLALNLESNFNHTLNI